MFKKLALLLTLALFAMPNMGWSGSLDFPGSMHGLSFGNSINFNGWRFNLADEDVETINGFNFTLLGNSREPKYVAQEINGLALGWEPSADVHNGLSLGGYQVNSNEIHGLALGVFGVEAHQKIQGIAVGGLYVTGKDSQIQGLAVGALWAGGTDSELQGISIASLNTTRKTQGIQIGLFNRTEELNGIQIGLINYAGNNSEGFKILPGLNAHLSF